MTMRIIVMSLIGALLIGSLAVHEGRMSSPTQVVERLANRPEVSSRFDDSANGRFDATVFLFTCIILTPIAALGFVLVLGIAMMLLEATVFQFSRRVGMPDGLTVVFVGVALGGLAWMHTDLWLSRSLRLIGTIARAWVVSTT
jgi:hypothetical protein